MKDLNGNRYHVLIDNNNNEWNNIISNKTNIGYYNSNINGKRIFTYRLDSIIDWNHNEDSNLDMYWQKRVEEKYTYAINREKEVDTHNSKSILDKYQIIEKVMSKED